MVVGVGSYADPFDIPGLAHFLEHMLFMGTQKYPDENEYLAFLAAHGGYANAYTARCHTNYYFQVASGHLADVLDRFSQFFTSPLLRKDCIDKEMKNVDSEHEKNLSSDLWRLGQVTRLLYNQSHPESKFNVGTINTLNITGIQESLAEFYESHYSSDHMKLVVVGKERVEELEAIVAAKFSAVPRRPVQNVHLGSNPFGDTARGKLIKVKTISPMDMLCLTFQLPETVSEYQSKHMLYLHRIITHGGPNGLSSHLKSNGLASKVVAGVSTKTKDYTFLDIDLTLTEKGYTNYKLVIKTILQFIDLLHSELPDWIFTDEQELMDIEFMFSSAPAPVDLASGKGEQMLLYAPADILSGPFIIKSFDKQKTKQLAEYLNRDNMLAVLASNRINEQQGFQTEKWYGTKYLIETLTLPEENITENVKFSLPQKNAFIPENFFLAGTRSASPVLKPCKYISNRNIPIWHKLDDTFMLPHSKYSFILHSPLINGTAESIALTTLLTYLFEFQSDELLYEGKEAGLSCSWVVLDDGLEITFKGYSDKMFAFIKLVGKLMSEFQPDPSAFELVKALAIKRSQGFEHRSAIFLARYECILSLETKGVGVKEVVSKVGEATVEQVSAFVKSLFSTSLDVEALVMGNVRKDDAVEHVDSFMNIIIPGYGRMQALPNKITNSVLSDNESSILVKKVIDNNFAVYKYIQLGEEADSGVRAMVNLIGMAFSDLVFQVLRTEQSLGYTASMEKRFNGQFAGVALFVQSAHADPIQLSSRIDDLIETRITKRLKELSKDEYKVLQKSAINALEENFSNLEEEWRGYLYFIEGQTYAFSRKLETAKAIQLTDLDSFKQFVFNNIIKNRKSFSVHAWPEHSQYDYKGHSKVYDDYKSFRNDHAV